MGRAAVILTYCIFFLSGAAALIYEIVWTRYLSLVFGGSHLAVTTVLTVFMTGLALGSYFIGRRIDNRQHLLSLFGYLELGTGASAMLFAGLVKVYPQIYAALAQFAPESTGYLTLIRVTFAFIVLIIPTTLMGGTLPVLTGFTSRLMQGASIRLSFLYGCNTIGAVFGAAATGFVMLRSFSMGKTLLTAVVINLFVGLAAILLQRVLEKPSGEELQQELEPEFTHIAGAPDQVLPFKLVIWGIGVSGFCAMGYEVLWSRVLSVAVGASAYGFTLLLMAFLSGIGLGSAAYGMFCRISLRRHQNHMVAVDGSIAAFGWVQVAIGVTALLATIQFRFLPKYVAFLRGYVLDVFPAGDQFQLVQLANFIMVFSVMFVPAFFMGVAIPLAGGIHCRYRRMVGFAVGELLSFNTIGAILGASVSGYLLMYLFGIQRSLQLIILFNIGYGFLVIASIKWNKAVVRLVAVAALGVLMVPVVAPESWRLWNPKMYAVYQSNKPEEYGNSDEFNEMLANMNIRYYAEGAQSIVSAVQSADILFFITNGRVEASNNHHDMQCQYVLGHLPMLLHKKPRHVFVLGTGSGMTLGAVSVHPTVEQITLAEIEPEVIGVAKTFGIDNHYILNKPDPRLKVVFNDGRNFLLTTKDKFDVITADPVHPWFSGAGYLYSTEYFRLAAHKLNPGGIICQWLPLYELTGENLKSVVRTIRENFAYAMIWVTHYDAEIIASNSPLIINEHDLDQRISARQVLDDLRQIKMGSAEDFLSYFVMGTEGATAYSRGGRINTDDNLYLEFSAPRSIGMEYLRAANLAEILQNRERILPYLSRPEAESERVRQQAKWEEIYHAALLEDRVHVLDVEGKYMTYEFAEIASELENRYPRYAPWRYTKGESGNIRGGVPRMLKEQEFSLLDENDALVKAEFLAVLVRKNSKSARIFFVDDRTQTVFGKLRVNGTERDAYIDRFASSVMKEVLAIYGTEMAKAAAAGKAAPSMLTVFPKFKALVEDRIEQE
jgi:spermidine synthase